MSSNSNVFSALSCTSFKVSGLILSFLIHFELILVQGERHGSSFSFLHIYIFLVSPAIFVEYAVFSPCQRKKGLGYLVKNQVGIAVWIHIRVLYSVFHVYFVPRPCCFYCYVSVVYSLKSGILILPALFILLSIALAIQSFVLPNEL
jgi:hypothetical protein